jgi:hypothetical protein
VIVLLAALHARVRYRHAAVGERYCVALRLCLSVAAAAVAGSPCSTLVSCEFACRSHSVALLLCESRQRLQYSAASLVYAQWAWGHGRVCSAAPPLCFTTVLTSMVRVQCSGVRSWDAACLDVVWMSACTLLLCPCAEVVSVRRNVAVLLCRCVCGTALHGTVAAAVIGSSRWRCAGV